MLRLRLIHIGEAKLSKEDGMIEARNVKSWYCPACNSVLGRVIYGELHTERKVNTSGSDLVVSCDCGVYKVWYTPLSLDSVVRKLSREIGRSVADNIR